jgi:hypothetical protein
MRRAMSLTSYDEGNLTAAQCRYLSLGLSTLAGGDEARHGLHGTEVEPGAEPVVVEREHRDRGVEGLRRLVDVST